MREIKDNIAGFAEAAARRESRRIAGGLISIIYREGARGRAGSFYRYWTPEQQAAVRAEDITKIRPI